ncbi:MAG: response regulator [Acidimicrobiia bacterium]|nr:response regulator [Acidimicrobiia bacterium]MDJ0664279.1 response regulator [Acidimicrobiia bacterium]
MRVLIIEDSAVLGRLIETCFRDLGSEFESQRLPHSPQRLGGFKEADLVVIGMYQPFTIGLGIVERLLARSNRPAIVAITTDTREKSIQTIEEAGVDAVVKMPFRPDDLRRAAESALAKRT